MGRRTLFNSIMRYIDEDRKWGKGPAAFVPGSEGGHGEAFVRKALEDDKPVQLSIVGAVLLGLRDRFPKKLSPDADLPQVLETLQRMRPAVERAFGSRLMNRGLHVPPNVPVMLAFNDNAWTTHEDMMYVLNSAKPEIDAYEKELEKAL